ERVEVPMQKAEDKRQTYKVFDYGANLLQSKEVFYRVRVIDAEGKSFWSVNTVTLEPNQRSAAIDCNTYPNPVKQTLFVEYNFGLGISKAKVTLVNAVGQVVYETEASADGNEQMLTIPVNDLPVGMYSLQLSNGNESITKKIIISQ
ncbi:MAG: T9SS type A sorting domain-containing protein, partial [Bacteroidia bacterium]